MRTRTISVRNVLFFQQSGEAEDSKNTLKQSEAGLKRGSISPRPAGAADKPQSSSGRAGQRGRGRARRQAGRPRQRGRQRRCPAVTARSLGTPGRVWARTDRLGNGFHASTGKAALGAPRRRRGRAAAEARGWVESPGHPPRPPPGDDPLCGDTELFRRRSRSTPPR